MSRCITAHGQQQHTAAHSAVVTPATSPIVLPLGHSLSSFSAAVAVAAAAEPPGNNGCLLFIVGDSIITC
ncbi:unnamed protein product [Coffea canephora]|uniref:Uncharacterized protein n=1 Tax=Coffea canephora TaxID=49390 RepID=A0A068V6P0_COFCA|nr:unnamed protein product [Coffea canephora]